MKTLLLILLIPLNALASLKENPPPGEPELGRCYAHGGVFFHHVVAKLSGNRYEMVSELRQLGRGVLKAKARLSPGPVGVSMKYTGKKRMDLENGFTAEIRQWEECKP